MGWRRKWRKKRYTPVLELLFLPPLILVWKTADRGSVTVSSEAPLKEECRDLDAGLL